MSINTAEQMQEALKEALDGTITLDGILEALQPHQQSMNILNELIRPMPSGVVVLILAIFAGCVMFDDELRVPEIATEDRLELLKRHARIAYAHLKQTMETDPRMSELMIQTGAMPPRPRVPTPTERRLAFQLLQGNKMQDE